MALSFAEPVSADFSLHAFASRGQFNPDGWGLAWYPDGGPAVALVKEPVPWGASPTAGFLASHPTLVSRIYLAHVREKTVGGAPRHADTHPFARELGGRDYAFAHNGTLGGPAWDLPLNTCYPVGATDSERFFCYLMGQLAPAARLAAPLAGPEDWAELHELLATANAHGKLNVLFSDGDRLFVYHDANGWKGLNFRRVRLQEGRPRHFGDDDLTIDLEPADGSPPTAVPGYVVATRPLSPAGWQPFQLGELIVFDRGRVAWSSHRSAEAPEFGPAAPIAARG